MPELILFTLTGLVAQFVNGSLGMGFGVTSNTVLLTYGIAPAVASASIQMANIGTGLVSGAAHHRFGNVSWPLVFKLGVPGAVGAFVGATVLSSLSGDGIVPVVAVVLIGLGSVVLVRSARGEVGRRTASTRTDGGLSGRVTGSLGLVGGFMNAIGGGGWGPVTTPALLGSGKVETRYVIGSVSAAEVLVTMSATVGFLIGLSGAVDVRLVLAMMAGGAVSAPFAAYLVGRLDPARLGIRVGTFLIVLNLRTLLVAAGAPPVAVVAVVLAVAAAGMVFSFRVGLTKNTLEPAGSAATG
jgi:uncharacterized protein